MAHITMFVSSIIPINNKIRIDGLAHVSPNSDTISWSCEHDWDAIAFDVNNCMRDAAVQAATDAGYHIGANDKKTLLCPAVDV